MLSLPHLQVLNTCFGQPLGLTLARTSLITCPYHTAHLITLKCTVVHCPNTTACPYRHLIHCLGPSKPLTVSNGCPRHPSWLPTATPQPMPHAHNPRPNLSHCG